MSLKDFFYFYLVHPSENFCAILVETIMGNIHANYFKFRPVFQELLFKEKV